MSRKDVDPMGVITNHNDSQTLHEEEDLEPDPVPVAKPSHATLKQPVEWERDRVLIPVEDSET